MRLHLSLSTWETHWGHLGKIKKSALMETHPSAALIEGQTRQLDAPVNAPGRLKGKTLLEHWGNFISLSTFLPCYLSLSYWFTGALFILRTGAVCYICCKMFLSSCHLSYNIMASLIYKSFSCLYIFIYSFWGWSLGLGSPSLVQDYIFSISCIIFQFILWFITFKFHIHLTVHSALCCKLGS